MVSLIAFLVVSCTSEPEIEFISQDELSKTDYTVTLEDAKIDLMEILSQLNGFYLSGAFDVRKGPSFDCNGDSISSDIYGDGNYIHELRAVIDIYN